MESTQYQLDTFLEFVRTKQFCLNALKEVNPQSFIAISMKDIKDKFLVNPKNDIQKLVDLGRLEVKETISKNGNKYNLYKCLEHGYIDLELLEPKGRELNHVTSRMMNTLKKVSLKEGTPRTQYFDTFLQNKEYLRLFFNVDDFSGRVHTPITNLKGEYRKNILLDEKETIAIDVVTMQPLLLSNVLKKEIGENEYSKWIDEGKDIYIMLKDKAKLKSRDEAKKKFFEILFSKPNNGLLKLFGNSTWIEWINKFKSKPFDLNPHTVEKNHSNLAWLLQNKEVTIMYEVWSKLLENGILFVSVHDEVIVLKEQYHQAKEIFKSVMDKYFTFYKLSNKNPIVEVMGKPPNDLLQYAINLIGYNNHLEKNQIPFFEELTTKGIITQAKPHQNLYYLSNSTPF
jgi:hypothetical protein